ncbi:MAG TPA: hypothetical protein VFK54_00135 [Candidatus Limnocylindrales bacterium]|nr:hypothetical protein [Candidatus Limnocylindrales bacterium]
MDRGRPLDAVLEELVAAIEERDLGDPDAVDWSVGVRIRRLERDLVAAYREDADLRRRVRERQDRLRADDPTALAGIV